ncbi:MAG TPA: CpaF family protein [Mycobacteriales bacterium]|nr:CpaF family protein [Mycobacteriales bacterium]
MKLSERLEQLDQDKKRPTRATTRTATTRTATTRSATTRKPAAAAPAAVPTPRRSERAAAGTKEAPARRFDDLKRVVKDQVVQELGSRLASIEDLSGEVSRALEAAIGRNGARMSPEDRARLVADVTSDMLGYGPLDALLRDPSVDEIMCNGYADVYVERRGRIEKVATAFDDEAHLRQVIQRIVSGVGRRVDEGSPMVDARLPDGSRVNAILPPLSVRGPVMTIRKFAERPFTITDLVANRSVTMDAGVFLEAAVRGKLNILIAGGTGSGKTTLLNVVGGFVPDDERVITIEDAAELQLPQNHVVTLESRPANAEGRGEVAIRDLVRNALRMRPDRIVVGEVRGAEALDMLQAMNTGHEGSLTTVHANSPRDVISRLETMVLMAGFDLPVRAIREQVASAVDLIVQTDRLSDGSRRVVAITEVQGTEGDIVTLQDIFTYKAGPAGKEGEGELVATGLRPRKMEALARSGVDLPPRLFVRPTAPAVAAAARSKRATR